MVKLEYERRRKGLTQLRLGFLCGVDPSYISRAENGKGRFYRSQIERIADALGWKGDPRELLEECE